MYKNNKRKYTGKSRTYSKKKGYKGNLTSSQKGYMRTGGNYGRYQKDGEMKFLDVGIGESDVDLNGVIVKNTILIIPQGTTQSERIGRKVVIKKLIFNHSWEIGTSTDFLLAKNAVRLIIYQDKQCNGAAAVLLDILNSADFHSSRNLTNSGRFKILCDKKSVINNGSAVIQATTNVITTGASIITESWYKDVNIPIEYDSTTGALTEIKSNNIGILAITQTASGTDLFGIMRIRYTDN